MLSLGQLGAASLYLALALAIYAAVSGILGATQREARLQTSARYAAVATFLAMTAAVLCLQAALLSDDFSVRYVAETSRIASPTWVKIATMWAALNGSILLWAWILSGYTALLAIVAPRTPLRPWGLAVMSLVQIFFTGVLVTITNPFVVLANPPADGPGPNPLLQNNYMMSVHPVLMYLGLVGLTVPFAYAIAALITRRSGSEWMRETRAWTLTGWGFLSAAILAGGWWSYDVLGWGGYWAWDPVENVIFLPWLTATAFIHGIQVQERRRMLKAWNAFLIVLTFNLSILGTFLIRSGVLSSVHSFGQGPVGPVFLGFFVLVFLVAFGLLALRWDQLRDTAELDAAVSREGSFLLNNVLFLGMAFMVLLGTLFPLIVEAGSGARVTVGAPFFDAISVPIWLAILALMGIGPLLPWRKAEGQTLRKNLAWMVGSGVVCGFGAYLLGVHKLYPALTAGFAGYNFASLGLLISGVLRPRMRATGRSALSVFKSYAYENRRRFGSMVVHFAIVIIALGVAGSSGYKTTEVVRVPFGQSVAFQGYTLHAVREFTDTGANRVGRGAVVTVSKGGKLLATLKPKLNTFGNNQPVAKPDVYHTPLRDIYLSVTSDVNPGQSYIGLRLVDSPLVNWIWFGGLLMALGIFYILVPLGRRERAVRKGAVPA